MCYNIYRWRKCQPDTGAFLEFYFLFFSFLFLSFGNPGEGWLRRDFRFRVITGLNLRFRRGVRALSNACIMLWTSYTALMNTTYDGWLVSWTLRDTLNKSVFRRKKPPDLWVLCENDLNSVFPQVFRSSTLSISEQYLLYWLAFGRIDDSIHFLLSLIPQAAYTALCHIVIVYHSGWWMSRLCLILFGEL